MSYAQSTLTGNHGQLVRLSNGKVAGFVENKTFWKPVCGSKHKLRTPPAWAIDAETYTQIRAEIEKVVVIDRETNTEYHAAADTFDRFRGELDRGFNRQFFLTLKHWTVHRPGEARQLSLSLGGVV